MNFKLSNITAQNTPAALHTIGMIILFIITISGSTAAACVATPTVFGSATAMILHVSVAVTTAGGILKLGIAAIGGNVNPNNITPETASATVDTSKPQAAAPAKTS